MRPHEQLEQAVSQWSGMPYVVACSSGTAALHLALEALTLPLRTQVIVPDFTMVACARAVVMAGLRPVFADCDDRLCIDPDEIDRIAGDATAVMPVHVYGRRCDPAVWDVAYKYGLVVVEDLAEAHGIKPDPRSDAACWSFYSNKIVHGEEGGCVGFKQFEHARLARMLRSQGFTPEHDFFHAPRGCNYRLADSLATLVLQSLEKLPEELDRRRRFEAACNEVCPRSWQMPARDVVWVYDFTFPGVYHIVPKLADARYAFKPMSMQPEFRRTPLPNALRASGAVAYIQPTVAALESFREYITATASSS